MLRVVEIVGPADYRAVHRFQEALVEGRAAGTCPDTVLVLEHSPVITVGRHRGADAHVLRPEGVPVVEVERGGDVTWHGPGQLVAYPIVALAEGERDLRAHLRHLEEAVIDLLALQGVEAGRDPRNTGVWTGSPPRKVCSIGIACRRWVTWHGLALNLTADLDAFRRIRPCGFEASVMTRLADHLDRCPDRHQLVEPLSRALAHHLGRTWDGAIRRVPAATLLDVEAVAHFARGGCVPA